MMAARDLVFIRDLLSDLGVVLAHACVIYSDSRSAVALAVDPVALCKAYPACCGVASCV